MCEAAGSLPALRPLLTWPIEASPPVSSCRSFAKLSPLIPLAHSPCVSPARWNYSGFLGKRMCASLSCLAPDVLAGARLRALVACFNTRLIGEVVSPDTFSFLCLFFFFENLDIRFP